jgi:hypothetical protein
MTAAEHSKEEFKPAPQGVLPIKSFAQVPLTYKASAITQCLQSLGYKRFVKRDTRELGSEVIGVMQVVFEPEA